MAGDLEFVISLPLAFGQMLRGDFSRAAQLTLNQLKSRPADTAMRYAMHIASGVSTERAARINLEKPRALFGNAINFPFDDAEFRAAWEIADLGEGFRAPLRSDVPTLFLSGDLDGRTSIEDADQVRRGFSRAQQMIVRGAAHDFYHLTPQVLANMLAFLEGKPVMQRIDVPVQLRGPDELLYIVELRKPFNEGGAGAAIRRLEEMAAASFSGHASSYVAGSFGVGLWQQDKKAKDAQQVLRKGVALYPGEMFLRERLADVSVELGEKDLATEHYRKCIELNSLGVRR
ncbi:MAG: alpha/beta hydrolase [Acidobacteriota bacterium]